MADRQNMNNGTEDEQVARLKEEKKKFKEEQKKLKTDQKQQKKEAKKKARELAKEESQLSDEEGSNFPVVITTIVIVLVWLGILCALVKLDVGGFGSNVLAPVLKNVPVVNKILPDTETESTQESGEDVDVSGYSSLKEAVQQIKDLESELTRMQEDGAGKDEQIAALEEEVARLQTFEDKQVEFERIKTEFYNEVVYADNGPGEEAYQKYFEAMDPATAEVLYKQVVAQIEEDKEVKDFAAAYSEMKPKEAAGIFEEMTDNLDLAARILAVMEADERGKILGAMDPEVAAKITKIMEPDS